MTTMKNAILAIVACASIGSLRAATEKTLSPAPGQNPALVTTTTILATDSPLVRAAKRTVAGRLHQASGNTAVVIDDSTVGRAPMVFSDTIINHAARILGESAPAPDAPPAQAATTAGAAGSGSAAPAAPNRPAASAPAPTPAAAAGAIPYGASTQNAIPRAPAMPAH
jgi:hypothetical protein